MLLRCQIDLARTIFYLPHIETKKKRWKTKTSQNEENFKSAQAPAWKIWMIKICPGLARPQLFRTLVRLIIFHLFRLRLAELDPKKQDRPMAIHGWRMLYHLMSFDIILCTGDVSRKTFGIAVFCMLCLLMSIGTVHHFQKIHLSLRSTLRSKPDTGPAPHLQLHLVCSAGAFLCKKW